MAIDQKDWLELIKYVERLIQKEKDHLRYLIDNDSPEQFVTESTNLLSHLEARLVEYKAVYDRQTEEETSHRKSWEDIADEYSRDQYPPFGGPFTDAMNPWEWLIKNYTVPVRKNN